MVTKERLEGMTAEQVMVVLSETKERWRAAADKANTAIQNYEKAVAMRDDKIRDLADSLTRQLEDISVKTASLKSDLLKATIADNAAEQAKIRTAISKLATQRTNFSTQLELLSEKPPRCDDAYAAMEKAVAESKDEETVYSESISVIREFCEEALTPWAEIIKTLRSYAKVDTFSLDRARSHYGSER